MMSWIIGLIVWISLAVIVGAIVGRAIYNVNHDE